MRAIVVEEARKASLMRISDPSPGPGEVVIGVRRAGVCGTDVHIYRGEYLADYPLVPGHEASGVIEELGDSVTALDVGDRVTFEPNICCDRCPACLRNEQNFCHGWQAVGVTRDGAMGERVAVPAKLVFDVGDLPFAAAAFSEPLSCVLHGVEKLDLEVGSRALLVGAGPIGCLMLQVLRHRGAAVVEVADLSEQRLELASRLGADATHCTEKGWEGVERAARADRSSDGFDVVVEATGKPEVMRRTVELARPGARILWFGVAARGEEVSVDAFEVFRKGLSIHASYTSRRHTSAAIRLLRSGLVRTELLVSHVVPPERAVEAIGWLEEQRPDVMKTQVEFEPKSAV